MKLVHQRTEPRKVANLLDSLAYDWLNRGASAVAARRGHKMAVFANDLIGNSINVFGAYEREEIATLFDYLAPLAPSFAQGTALDIGANIGNHALIFSRFFKSVHAFEPNPQSFRLLEINAANRPNIVTHRFGLGDVVGRFHLLETPENVGQSVVVETGEFEIELKRLDDLAIDDVRFIKIDVEGYEARVIAGGAQFLRRHQPIIAFEQLAHEFDGHGSPTLRALSDLGYRFCWLEDGAVGNRRIASFVELVTGRKHKVFSGDVPPRTRGRREPLIQAGGHVSFHAAASSRHGLISCCMQGNGGCRD